MDIEHLLNFLDHSPTSWHAVHEASKLLLNAGFTPLDETKSWKIKPGGRYFVMRNGSSLCAFIVPKEIVKVHLVGTHTDSPGFKLKPKAEFRKENMILFGLETYGSPLITSWLNRDLGIAGRVVYLDTNNFIQESLVKLTENPVVIPQLAIHLDRQVNEQGLLLNKQDHLSALVALTENQEEPYLHSWLKKVLNFKQILGHDLFLFPLEKASLIGFQQQMIAAYRVDSLNSVHAAVSAICQAQNDSEILKMITLWDNEEIGSETPQGAASPFLSHTLERIALALNMNREAYLSLLRRSLCLSVDLAHAIHPNYNDRHEPRHPVLMGEGIAIKYNSNYRYASDARSAGLIAALCEEHQIKYQTFVTKGDIPCGTTIGPIHASQTGMPTVDIGCAQLSMHSSREITATKDYLQMSKLLKQFL